MKIFSLRGVAAALGCACAFASQAAVVNFEGWAFGSGPTVKVGTASSTWHHGSAGAFGGTLTFVAGDGHGFEGVIGDFISYCVEIDEHFKLPSGNMTGYAVVAAADYTKWGNAHGSGQAAAQVGERIGSLMSWLAGNPLAVDTASESAALQIAIWNLIYDADATLAGGAFREKSSSSALRTAADALLAASAGWANAYDVFVLAKAGSQDFLLLREKPVPFTTTSVPEPGGLALAATALLLLRRRAVSAAAR